MLFKTDYRNSNLNWGREQEKDNLTVVRVYFKMTNNLRFNVILNDC